jgi:hypothetical protein
MATLRLSTLPRLAGLSALALAIGALAPSPAQSQASGTVDVDINLQNGITILYYFSALDVNVNITDIVGTLPAGCSALTAGAETACAMSPAAAVTASPTGGPPATSLQANFNIAPPALGLNPAVMPLVLQNVWAVRAIGGGANTSVAIAAGTTTLNGPSGATMVLGAFQVASTGATGSPGATISFPDPGLVNARSGDVRLNLNMTNATQTGTYSTATPAGDTNYTLTVTNT